MKRVLKVVAGLIALVVVAGAGFAAYIHFGWPVHLPTQTIDVKVAVTPERVAHGKKLVSLRCAGCHYNQETGALTGQHLAAEPVAFGKIYSKNITKHPTKGSGRYSDGELLYLLRTGIRRDGVYTGPYMMAAHMADEDVYSIIAFLRSDDPWVKAADIDDQQSEPSFLLKFLFGKIVTSIPYPTHPIAPPNSEDKVALGKYLVTSVADCFVCHSESFKTLNAVAPENSGGFMGGGNELLDARGLVVRGANLTMNPDHGIGKWTEAEFIKTVRTGFRPDRRPLRYPMVPMTELTEGEVSAIYAYLKTLPPSANSVERNFGALPPEAGAQATLSGEELYNRYQCTSCHGNEGFGVCDLREASKKYDTDEKLAAFVRDPSQFVPETKMPTWDGVLAEGDYAPLVAHIHVLEKRKLAAK